MKEIKWNINAKNFVRNLDRKTKIEIGSLLLKVQMGVKLNFPHSRPMSIIYPKTFELRLKDAHGSYRLIYNLYKETVILIPHAFIKQTRTTPLKEIEIAKKRLSELMNESK